MRLLARILVAAFLAVPAGALAAERWALQIFGGAPYNFNLPLRIHQSGQPDLKVTGNYESRPFETPYYYAVRAGAWNGDKAWELELIHDKLYLKDKPPEVGDFAISHGFNLLTVNRAWELEGFIFRTGLGVVITHPETTIRGRTDPQDGGIFEGYHVSGPTAQGAVEKRFRVGKRLIVSLEAKLTASYAWIPVEGGHADVPDVAVHGLFGLGAEI